ncbi:sodium/proline symporter [Peptococcus simiae]|uniref:sodium/proline symporter n=1 Tax=Peptococcus simiae TaxID=1643805 RepID=UPI003980AEFA
MQGHLQIGIAMAIYLTALIGIGVYFARQASKSTENFFLGGRSLGPLVTAMSAEASDMSGWLLMGLPGVAYWMGLSSAFWTAIGLAVGTYINWLIVAKRLRVYSHIAGDAITVPDYMSNRFKEEKPILKVVAAIIILFFFTVYAASCFVTMGKLFHTVFDMPYIPMMILGSFFVIFYTTVGGFLAESVADTLQGFIMLIALVAVLGVGFAHVGGLDQAIENARRIPGFLEFFMTASPTTGADGVQTIAGGLPQFGQAEKFSAVAVASTLAWGLGYFGVPQVLLRFMAIRDKNEIKMSRRIATGWVIISLLSAVTIGLLGRLIFPTALGTASEAESVFVLISSSMLPPLLAGFVMAGILAATASSADSYLLISASALAKNIYHGVLNKDATERQVLRLSRLVLLGVALVAMILASDKNSVIFNIVSFAWAGFGASIGPVILMSLFWRRTTGRGALAGMISGGLTVIIWRGAIAKLGGVFAIYELLPAFIVAIVAIVIVSLLDKPNPAVLKEFDQYADELHR